MKKSFIFFLVVICFCVYGCKKKDAEMSADSIEKATVVKPISFGSGVYYFNVIEEQFGKSLAGFIAKNSNLEIVTMSPNEYKKYGRVVGYFVVFRLNSER